MTGQNSVIQRPLANRDTGAVSGGGRPLLLLAMRGAEDVEAARETTRSWMRKTS